MKLSLSSLSLGVLLPSLGACAAPHEQASAPPGPPIACSLSPEELSAQSDELLPGLFTRASAVTELEDGVSLRFESRPGLLAEIAAVIERERACCSFLRFQLTAEPNDGSILFEVTGPPGTREMLRAL